MALLHLFSRLCQQGQLLAGRISALHVHHGLSPHADDWAAFCHDYCQQLAIPLHVERVSIDRADTAGQGLEAAARAARHAAFADPVKNGGADFVVLAHHADDQAETLLFNLLRGAGVQGAAAMPAVRPLALVDGVQLCRPLLAVPRARLEAYLAETAQPWIEDESNQDTRFSRNYLRHAVLPVLQQRFPQAVSQLSQASQHFAEAQGLLAEVATSDAATVALVCMPPPSAAPVQGFHFVLAGLLVLSPARQANLLRHVLRRAGWQMPESRQLEELLRQLQAIGEATGEDGHRASTDQQFAFRLSAGVLYCWQGRVHGVLHAPAVPVGPVFWTGEAPLVWGGEVLQLVAGQGRGQEVRQGGRISQQRWAEAGGVQVRLRQGGESLQIAANRPRRPLKKLLQESGLPPWQRASLPLLLVDDTLIACAGIGIDPRWQAGPDEPGWQLCYGAWQG